MGSEGQALIDHAVLVESSAKSDVDWSCEMQFWVIAQLISNGLLLETDRRDHKLVNFVFSLVTCTRIYPLTATHKVVMLWLPSVLFLHDMMSE